MRLYYYDTLNPRKACAGARYLHSPVEFVHIDLAGWREPWPAEKAVV